MKSHVSIALSIAISGLTGHAMAAERDMSKLTCKEVADMPGGKPVAVVMWFNGYVHGKLGNPMLDGDKAHESAAKVAAYCKEHPDATVADAIKAIGEF